MQTKMTQKGQVTIPQEMRQELGLETGSVVEVKMGKSKIIIERPKVALSELAGSCEWFTKEIEAEIKDLWKTWRL